MTGRFITRKEKKNYVVVVTYKDFKDNLQNYTPMANSYDPHKKTIAIIVPPDNIWDVITPDNTTQFLQLEERLVYEFAQQQAALKNNLL